MFLCELLFLWLPQKTDTRTQLLLFDLAGYTTLLRERWLRLVESNRTDSREERRRERPCKIIMNYYCISCEHSESLHSWRCHFALTVKLSLPSKPKTTIAQFLLCKKNVYFSYGQYLPCKSL